MGLAGAWRDIALPATKSPLPCPIPESGRSPLLPASRQLDARVPIVPSFSAAMPATRGVRPIPREKTPDCIRAADARLSQPGCNSGCTLAPSSSDELYAISLRMHARANGCCRMTFLRARDPCLWSVRHTLRPDVPALRLSETRLQRPETKPRSLETKLQLCGTKLRLLETKLRLLETKLRLPDQGLVRRKPNFVCTGQDFDCCRPNLDCSGQDFDCCRQDFDCSRQDFDCTGPNLVRPNQTSIAGNKASFARDQTSNAADQTALGGEKALNRQGQTLPAAQQTLPAADTTSSARSTSLKAGRMVVAARTTTFAVAAQPRPRRVQAEPGADKTVPGQIQVFGTAGETGGIAVTPSLAGGDSS